MKYLLTIALFIASLTATFAQDLDKYYKQVQYLIDKKDFFAGLDAIEILEKYCQSDTTQVHYWTALASASFTANIHKDAFKYIDKALEINPRSATVYYTKARLVNEIYQDNNRSIQLLDTAIKLNNRNLLYFQYRGRCLQAKGEYKKARQDYAQTIKLGSKNQTVYRNYAVLLSRTAQSEQALTYIKKAIELAPTKINYEAQGNIHIFLANPQAACASYDIAFRLGLKRSSLHDTLCKSNDNQSNPLEIIAELAMTERLSYTAIRAYTKLLKAGQKKLDYYYGRGSSYFALEQYTKAAKDFKQGLKIVAEQYQRIILLQNLRLTYTRLKQRKKVKFYTNKIREMKAEATPLLLKQGRESYEYKQYGEAIKLYNLVIELDSLNAEAYAYRALAQLGNDHLNEALKDANKSIAIRPAFAPGWMARGHAKRRLKMNGYCVDYAKAASAGSTKAPKAIKQYCAK